MKSEFLLMSVLASLFMWGCAQEKIVPNGETDGEVETNYLAVNLVSSDISSRASSGYEDGESYENKVNKVRFYFFNRTGGAALVKLAGNKYVNYYDWTPGDTDQNEDKDNDDVESVLSATIIINTAKEDRLPSMVAAVLNPTISDDNSRSLTDLKSHYDDYAKSELTKEGRFVMYNSVFAQNNTDVSATLIAQENLQKTEEGAKQHPVTIYVERNVAKVSVSLDAGFDSATNRLHLKTNDDQDLTVDGKQVYLELSGWDLTAETSEGRLVKKINPGWTGWNWNGTYRSFWAINSMSDKIHNVYSDYNAIDNNFDKALYTNENAQKTDIDATIKCNAENNTKVILKGTLCDENGDPLTVVRHLGAHFIDTCDEDDESKNLPLLKDNILRQLATSKNYYYASTGEGNVNGRKQIGIGDIQIVTVKQKPEEGSKNNCYVCARLTKDAESKTWYDSADSDASPIRFADINTALSNKDVVSLPLVWKSGMTYYYYDIKHLAESNETGVVRNHIYKTKVTKIAGLGTPVYDPGEVIYPEKPDANDHYIAAEVDILSWRIVENSYELEW